MPQLDRTAGGRPTVAHPEPVGMADWLCSTAMRFGETPFITEHQVNLMWELLRSTGLDDTEAPEDAQALLEAAHARLRTAGAFGALQSSPRDVEALDVFLAWWVGAEVQV